MKASSDRITNTRIAIRIPQNGLLLLHSDNRPKIKFY